MSSAQRHDAAPTARRAASRLLGVGTAVSLVLLATGVLMILLLEHGTRVEYSVYTGADLDARSPASILSAVRTLHPRAVLALGVLVLILTPLARVLLCGAIFTRARDVTYALISLVVGAWLVLGLFGALA